MSVPAQVPALAQGSVLVLVPALAPVPDGSCEQRAELGVLGFLPPLAGAELPLCRMRLGRTSQLWSQ